MRVRDWTDVLSDVTDAGVDPDGWRAVAGHRADGLGEELFLGHPNVGVYELKTYTKNPLEVRGVGSRVARRIDDDIEPLLPRRGDDGGRFAVQSPPEGEEHAKSMTTRLEETMKVHAEAPTTSETSSPT